MAQPPYDQLYIYELLGDARPQATGLGDDYLGLWLEGDTSFLFFSRPATGEIAKILAADSRLTLREHHHLTYEQWQGGIEFNPLEFEGLAVVPAWQEYTPRPGQKVIRLDPGLVFGSGLHPTTRHSLELLLLRAELGPLGRVLDLGCGTGILGLAAAIMGAESVLAVDLNPLCVSTTRRNAKINQLHMDVAEGRADEYLTQPAELVLANLHLEAHKDLWAREDRLAGKKDLILSGLTRSQVDFLEDMLSLRGYHIHKRRQSESTWFSLWARRPS
ncbi:MAG: 50S ribosomal protein L11 methyltransferase [Desulfarculaceae bacterium]|jgi:ribosomal protein L11 methyltransferase